MPLVLEGRLLCPSIAFATAWFVVLDAIICITLGIDVANGSSYLLPVH